MSAIANGVLNFIDDPTRTITLPSTATRQAWSHNGRYLAAWGGGDIHILGARGSVLLESYSFPDRIRDVAWIAGRDLLVIALDDETLIMMPKDLSAVLDCRLGTDPGPTRLATALGGNVAAAHLAGAVSVWRAPGRQLQLVAGIDAAHDGYSVWAVAWLPDGRLATAGSDGTARIWTIVSDKLVAEDVYESGAEGSFVDVSVSDDGKLMATLTDSDLIHVFDLERRTLRARLRSSSPRTDDLILGGFRPLTHTLNAASRHEPALLEWKLPRYRSRRDAQYKNAKVVLVGDSGVGKSGLALRLSSQPFVPTESTHGRHVWTMSSDELRTRTTVESRDVLLWDLAGQPGYRLFHRLSLRDVAVGLVVFDASHESDPFRGVAYWARALGESAGDRPVTKILVSARADRGGITASRDRIQAILDRYGFQAFVETSAKNSLGIEELATRINESINWDDLPLVVAPRVFLTIRDFLVSVKQSGRLVVTVDELRDLYAATPGAHHVTRQVFETCLQRLETAGLVSRLSLRERWLLQPEALDNYSAWLSIAARQEPDGLGAIAESRALEGNFRHESLRGTQEESLMLLTAVEEVVGRGLALRVNTDASGQVLVFPSELRADLPDFPGGYDIEVRFTFGGPVSAIYAAIATGLYYSLAFGTAERPKLFRNAALYRDVDGLVYGFAAHELEDQDTSGRVLVFFDSRVPSAGRRQFVRYIHYQLLELSLEGTVELSRVYTHCGLEIDQKYVSARRNAGHETVVCPVCTAQLQMTDYQSGERIDAVTARLLRKASDEKTRQQRLSTVHARERADEYHAFICYNRLEKALVDSLVSGLRSQGIACWQDSDRMFAGDVVPAALDVVLLETPVALIALGPNSLGPFQEHEYYALLQRAIGRREGSTPLRLIPVLLPGGPAPDEVPPLMTPYLPVDLRRSQLAEGQGPERLATAILAPRR